MDIGCMAGTYAAFASSEENAEAAGSNPARSTKSKDSVSANTILEYLLTEEVAFEIWMFTGYEVS